MSQPMNNTERPLSDADMCGNCEHLEAMLLMNFANLYDLRTKATDKTWADAEIARQVAAIRQRETAAVRAELEWLESHGHGGGNWRRLLIQRKARLTQEKQ